VIFDKNKERSSFFEGESKLKKSAKESAIRPADVSTFIAMNSKPKVSNVG